MFYLSMWIKIIQWFLTSALNYAISFRSLSARWFILLDFKLPQHAYQFSLVSVVSASINQYWILANLDHSWHLKKKKEVKLIFFLPLLLVRWSLLSYLMGINFWSSWDFSINFLCIILGHKIAFLNRFRILSLNLKTVWIKWMNDWE